MKIGIDLRALQTGHKYRGIGEVAKQTTNRILELAQQEKTKNISFIFYEYDDDDPKELLSIPEGVNYKVIKLGTMPENSKNLTTSEKIERNVSHLYGSPVKHSKESDVFLQFDYAFGVPKNTKTVLIKHDLIPYIFWDKYFESAWVPFKNKAARTTIRTVFTNHKFKRVLTRSLKNAHVILAVSNSTKQDIEKYFKIKSSKVKTAHLGVDIKPSKTNDILMPTQHPTKPYLLFVGAGDARRHVEDAVAAYNNLKAEGKDIQLVLVGENFKSPELIPNPVVRNAVISSSYKDDILTLGYIDDVAKQELYRHAISFVYPTSYEGFGIPVLEAMLLECPIITYKNSSIPEVGGEYAYYAKNWFDIKRNVEKILMLSTKENTKRKKAAQNYAKSFTWDRTAQVIYDELKASAP
jgi:glycosyltransferase involved in cell wall biosynthesis